MVRWPRPVILESTTATTMFAMVTVVPTIVEVTPMVVSTIVEVAAVFTPTAVIAGVRTVLMLGSRVICRFTNRQPNLTVISNGQYFDRYLIPNG